MNKMTDERIKKALKVCVKNETPFCCGECELGENNSSCDCVDRLLKLSLDLINRQQKQLENYSHNVRNMSKDFIDQQKIIQEQQAEIEKLNVELVGMRGACNSYKMHYDNAKAEIEVLKVDAKRVDKDLEELDRPLTEIRVEAIKEYMKILEEKLSQNTDISNVGYQSIIFDMEQGYKEMVGECNV